MTLRPFLSFLSPYRVQAGIALLLMASAAGLSALEPYLIKIAIDTHMVKGDIDGLGWLAFLFLVASLGEYGVKSSYTAILQWIGQRVLGRLRQSVFRRILRLPMARFDQTPSGVLLSRTVSDAESLGETLASGIVSIFLDVITIVATLAMMIVLSAKLALGVILLFPLLALSIRWFSAALKHAFSKVRHFNAELSGYLAESLSGLSVIQLFRKEIPQHQKFVALNRGYCSATVTSNVYDASLYALMEGMAAIAIGALLLVIGIPALKIAFTAGLIVAFMEYLQRIFTPIKEFSAKIAMIQRARVDLDRLFGILNDPDHLQEGPIALSTIHEGIRFDQVSFRYRPETEAVLHDISFSVNRGETIAIVGPTGSGKTTLIKLLLRHYDHDNGTIFIDAHDHRTLTRESLYRLITVVAQDVFLFEGSIYDNIALDRPTVTLARAQWAAEVVNAHRFINRYPDTYHHIVSERGENLSAGEAQLLSFARAMASDADVVILDEATGSIDSDTEHDIEVATAHILTLKTCIVIAHRLSTLKRVDRILVLKNGSLIEDGTHTELLAKRGEYYRLYEAQLLEHVPNSDSTRIP